MQLSPDKYYEFSRAKVSHISTKRLNWRMIGWIVNKITLILSSAGRSERIYRTSHYSYEINIIKNFMAGWGKKLFCDYVTRLFDTFRELVSALSVLNLRWKVLSTTFTLCWHGNVIYETLLLEIWCYIQTGFCRETSRLQWCSASRMLRLGTRKYMAYHDVKAAARIIPCGPAIPPWMYCTVIYWSLTCKCNMGMMTGDSVIKCTEML